VQTYWQALNPPKREQTTWGAEGECSPTMTWLLPTCSKQEDTEVRMCRRVSSALAYGALLTTLLTPLSAATVSGRVDLRDSKDALVSKKGDYSGVVVWLEPLNGEQLPVPPGIKARMVQKDKTFTPHVLAIPVGATVDFPNFDPIFHNAFSNYDGQLFDVGLYPPGTSRSVRFNRPGIVRVFCNIHASMSAVIAVLATPYFDSTQKNGNFEIRDVPPGEYRLKIFHERATMPTLDGLSRRIAVGTGGLVVPPIAVSESGYLVVPHTNKFGHDYADHDERGVYPGKRK
jgi:plastocyanin